MQRQAIADHIVARLQVEAGRCTEEFALPDRIGSCQVLDLLPDDLARAVHARFPSPEEMVLKHSIKESKHVAAQMDRYDPLLEETVYAFQDTRVVDLVGRICGIDTLEPDVDLYAGGISTMTRGSYLRPHLDNSHDAGRARYRVLNLLYYVSPGWRAEYGGSLQLWDEGPTGAPRTVPSLFNSLAIMITDEHSWHSVDEVTQDARRCCVSNYYFSKRAPRSADYFHATTFRGEQGRGAADLVMRADNAVRTAALRVGGRFWSNPHVYKRSGE